MASFGLLYQLSQTILQMSMPMESFGYYKRGMPMASFCLFINFREQLYKSMPMESFGYNRSMLQTWDAYGILQLIVSIFANNYTNAR